MARLKRQQKIFFLCLLISLLLLPILLDWVTNSSGKWLPRHIQNSFFNKNKYIQRFPYRRTNLNRTMKILLWTPWFNDPNWGMNEFSTAFSKCPVSDCVYTKNKSEIVQADVILFHLNENDNKNGHPKFRTNNQIYVMQFHEPPSNIHFDLKTYNGIFNWTVSYRTDSDVYAPYGMFTPVSKEQPVQNVAITKSAVIAWAASNCNDHARRQKLVKGIQKYLQVDTYGKCGKHMLKQKNTYDVLRKYKFYLSFENAHCRDYITEKFFRPLQHLTIPVVSGGGDYRMIAPPNSYIDVRDFKDIKDLVSYLKYLDTNDTAYNSYFEWTKKYSVSRDPGNSCRLCEAVHDESRMYQVYEDMEGYISDDTCQRLTIHEWMSLTKHRYGHWFGLV